MSSVTELDLDAIEARLDDTTAGPWVVAADTAYSNITDRVTSEHIVEWVDDDGTVYRDAPFVCDTDSGMEETQHPEEDEANAQFIAHARTDVPALVAEVRRLRGELS